MGEDLDGAIVKAKEILIKNDKKKWSDRREKLLSDMIDVTSFMTWFVENYPESIRILKENPDYQFRFK